MVRANDCGTTMSSSLAHFYFPTTGESYQSVGRVKGARRYGHCAHFHGRAKVWLLSSLSLDDLAMAEDSRCPPSPAEAALGGLAILRMILPSFGLAEAAKQALPLDHPKKTTFCKVWIGLLPFPLVAVYGAECAHLPWHPSARHRAPTLP